MNSGLRDLESWHDEDEVPLDESCYQELADIDDSIGWSADEMFRYNERIHKVTSTYSDKILAGNYTTPLPKNNSKYSIKLATKLAQEIEDRVLAEGRVTPESSDDDEQFENKRENRRAQRRQPFQSNQSRPHHHYRTQERHQINNQDSTTRINNHEKKVEAEKSSQYSNSTETPITASLSSSPTINETLIKPVTSSSRNILRTCLTKGYNICV